MSAAWVALPTETRLKAPATSVLPKTVPDEPVPELSNVTSLSVLGWALTVKLPPKSITAPAVWVSNPPTTKDALDVLVAPLAFKPIRLTLASNGLIIVSIVTPTEL